MGRKSDNIQHTNKGILNSMMKQQLSSFDRIHLLFLILIIGGIVTGVYLISSQQRLGLRSKAAQETPPVRAFFTLDQPIKQRGKEFQLIVKLNPNGSSFLGFQLNFTYDKEKVDVAFNFLDDLGQAYDAEKGFFKRIEKDKDTDKIQVYGAKLGGEPLAGNEDIEIAKIRFKLRDQLTDGDKILFSWDSENTKLAGDKTAVALNSQEGVFIFGSDQTQSQSQQIAAVPPIVPPVIPPQSEALVPVLPSPTNTPAGQPTPLIPPTLLQSLPTPTIVPLFPTSVSLPPRPTSSPMPQNNTLTILLKFQGISQKPKRSVMPVSVTVKGELLEKPLSQTIQFTADDQGIWKGQVKSSIIPKGYRYSFSVKGPHHKEVQFCHQAPIEKKPGTYKCADRQISITSDQQVFDFSHVILPAGDLQSDDGPSDGVINSRDAVFVKAHLLTQDEKIRDKVDINGDEEATVIDYALLLKGLEIQQ